MSDQSTSSKSNIDKSVLIHRPIADVWNFYSDFRNLPKFLGDVTNIEIQDATTSRWTIEVPFGIHIHWETKITASEPQKLIRYELAGSKPSSAVWEVYFASAKDPKDTTVREVLIAPMNRLESLAMSLIGKYPAQEVQANLQRLKEVLETGKVTTTAYAVEGKFGPKA